MFFSGKGGGGGPCCDDEENMPDYGFAGHKSGDYIKETKYVYVGEDQGEHAKIPNKARGRNCTLFLGLLIASALIGLLASKVLKGGQPSQQGIPAAAMASDSLAPRFNCVPDGLEKGERVQATADIAFQPSGFVRQGTRGTVVAETAGPSTGGQSGERIVTVAWDNIPGLKSSRVYRDMLSRAIEVGDRVEAAAETEYQAPKGSMVVDASLDVADLVRATQDLGGVKAGTYGTVVAVPPSAGLTLGHVVVRFVNQLSTVKVQETHIARAPQVGDRVRSISAIAPKAGDESVQAGTVGTVVAVNPASYEYRFTVEWRGHERTNVAEAELERLKGSEGAVVPKGAAGRVVEAAALDAKTRASEQRFIVDWASFVGPGSETTRGHLRKVEDWSSEKTAFCSGGGQAPAGGAAADAGDGGAAAGQAAQDYDCAQGAPGSWVVAKATWCCDHASVACEAKNSPHSSGPTVVEPLAVPASFDPAPRTVLPTAEPIESMA